MPASTQKPIHVDDRDELDEFIGTEDRLLVDFYTEGCTLCQAIEPVLGNVARASDVAVALFNPRNDLDAVAEFDVRSVPTLVLFEDGKPVRSMAEGFQGTEAILAFVDEEVAASDGDGDGDNNEADDDVDADEAIETDDVAAADHPATGDADY